MSLYSDNLIEVDAGLVKGAEGTMPVCYIIQVTPLLIGQNDTILLG